VNLSPETKRLARGMLRVWIVFAVLWTGYVVWQVYPREVRSVESAHREAMAFLHKTWNSGVPVYVKNPAGAYTRFEFMEQWYFGGLPMNEGDIPRDVPQEVADCLKPAPKDGKLYLERVPGKNMFGYPAEVPAVVFATEELAKNSLGMEYRLHTGALALNPEIDRCISTFYMTQVRNLQDEHKEMWWSFWTERVKRVLWPILWAAAGLAILIWLIEGFRSRKAPNGTP
jgi:hypothetical protein